MLHNGKAIPSANKLELYRGTAGSKAKENRFSAGGSDRIALYRYRAENGLSIFDGSPIPIDNSKKSR
jgi:hypothetical protein